MWQVMLICVDFHGRIFQLKTVNCLIFARLPSVNQDGSLHPTADTVESKHEVPHHEPHLYVLGHKIPSHNILF